MNTMVGEIYVNGAIFNVFLFKPNDSLIIRIIGQKERVLVLRLGDTEVVVLTIDGIIGEILPGQFSKFFPDPPTNEEQK